MKDFLPDSITDRPLDLGLGVTLLRGRSLALPVAALLVLPLAVTAAVLFLALPGVTPGELAERLADALRHGGHGQQRLDALLGLLALLLPVAAVFWLGQRRARLRADGTGLHGDIPRWLGIGLFQQTAGRWHVPWSAVRRVRLVEPRSVPTPVHRLGVYRLVIETADDDPVWLSPFLWFERGGPDHRLTLREALRPRRLDAETVVSRAPLLRLLRARGLEVERERAVQPRRIAGFDLARHRGMVVQLAALFAGGLYALVDTFFLGHYEALGALPAWPFALVAGAATLGVLVLGRGAPGRERLVVGALTVAALTAAVHPATLRLNALTATPRTVAYAAAAPGRFLPPSDRLPAIDLSGRDLDAYWSRYPPGATHEFTVLRGAGGFHQLDLSPLYERTRRFYAEHPAPAGTAGAGS